MRRTRSPAARTLTLIAAGPLVASVLSCLGAERRSEQPQQAHLARAVAPPARLTPPESLPGPARAILQRRMAGHARDLGELMSAIMVLDYPRIRERAEIVAADASLSRPLTGDATELNSALPEKFFVHQDELRESARALAAAAERTSAFAVADAYERLAGACVRCHASYRAGR